MRRNLKPYSVQLREGSWAIYPTGKDSPAGYVRRFEAINPSNMWLYAAVRAEDGRELGVYKSRRAAIEALLK
jgi:hypothetical protein